MSLPSVSLGAAFRSPAAQVKERRAIVLQCNNMIRKQAKTRQTPEILKSKTRYLWSHRRSFAAFTTAEMISRPRICVDAKTSRASANQRFSCALALPIVFAW
jgi:hypothetical protein